MRRRRSRWGRCRNCDGWDTLVVRDGLEGRKRHDKLRLARRRPPRWADARFIFCLLNILSHHVILTDAYHVLHPCLHMLHSGQLRRKYFRFHYFKLFSQDLWAGLE